ncbi:MAG: SBBP repeat-containing protein, partial [Acidobacteria bacterium]|nr:SBBP repeat-containing protein [Acidobacteriota bacterium]
KLSADGSRIVYSTYLGGGGNDRLFGIAVDDSGGAYVCGDTTSTDFPVTAAAQKQRNGTYDAIAAKLSPDGAKLVYATYLGGTAGNSASAIAVDSKGRAVLTGDTQSPDFPVTTGALAPSHPGNDRDAFVIRLSGTGAIDYASYLGGTQEEYGMAVAFDSAGNVLIAGQTFSPDFPATSSAVLPFFQGDSKAFLTGLQLP